MEISKQKNYTYYSLHIGIELRFSQSITNK